MSDGSEEGVLRVKSEGEELEGVDESAIGKLMASAVERPRCEWFLKCLLLELAKYL